VQILCLQEVFNGPYFCPSQDAKWCDIAEAIPDGPTIQLMQKLAKKHAMVIIVPIYEREMAGVYYNTAAVIDADGTYLGKYRKNHIPHTAGFWEKFFFKPWAIRSSRRATRQSASTSATTATFPRAPACSACTAPRSCSIRRRP
jgi:predicted amidohydrolase